ncbi:MAG: PorT family protein, partial [Hymenobacter sp.]
AATAAASSRPILRLLAARIAHLVWHLASGSTCATGWAARPTIPAARPDSTPAAHAGRRWSLLLLAGPTLSYRTLGPAPTLAAGRPDFARLERPAVGLGAQVQVRRVLSGRWAVAAGVGYHEYATRLALSVKDSNTYIAVRQRDTYRLLTVPVQFTYALGAPRRRLAVGLLLGAEPGWYVGGRSTEGSDCGCQQQAYTSATGSPYRSLSLAFSLGLDLRYRVGGAATCAKR